jgi:hypothetical protein
MTKDAAEPPYKPASTLVSIPVHHSGSENPRHSQRAWRLELSPHTGQATPEVSTTVTHRGIYRKNISPVSFRLELLPSHVDASLVSLLHCRRPLTHRDRDARRPCGRTSGSGVRYGQGAESFFC